MIQNSNEDFSLKLLLLGDTNTGKTSILSRFTDEKNEFNPSHIATIGMDQKMKYVNYKEYKIKLDIWDSAGQERFQAITTNYIRGVDGVIYVFDLTNIDSLNNLKNWFKLTDRNVDSNLYKKIVMANKCDLEDKIQVSDVEIKKFCEKYNIRYIASSALLNKNISEGFMMLIEDILSDENFDDILENKRLRRKNNLSIHNGNVSKPKCC